MNSRSGRRLELANLAGEEPSYRTDRILFFGEPFIETQRTIWLAPSDWFRGALGGA